MFECISDSASVASYAALHPSPLATRRLKALSGIEQTLSSLDVTNHSRGQSLDLGRKNAATSSSKNSDIDHAVSQVSSSGSISDTESCFYDQRFGAQVTKPLSPNRQVIELWLKDMQMLLANTERFDFSFFIVVYNQENLNLELQKLRIELRHAQGMHAVAQSENTDASQMVMSFFSLSKHFQLLFLCRSDWHRINE